MSATEDDYYGKRPGDGTFWLQIAWLALLIGAAALHLSRFHWSALDGFDDSVLGIPLSAFWFGAVGGSMSFWYKWQRVELKKAPASTTAAEEWNRADDYFWFTRPVVAALSGMVGCLLIKFLGNAITEGDAALEPVTFAVTAFVIGFGNETFLGLVTSATDMVIRPGKG